MKTTRPLSAQAQVCFILLASFAIAALQNVTVDDSVSAGPVVVTYLPTPTDWAQGNTCSGCFAQPDPYYAYNGTWHDATLFQGMSYTPEFEFTFVGSGLWIYFILANNISGTSTFTSVSFILDGVQVSTFTHQPSTSSDYEYNQVVYANDSIPYGQHTMQVTPAADNELMLFDYLMYTTNADSTTTTTSSVSSSGPTPTSSGTPTSSSGTSSGLSTEAIIGIAVGVGAIALATALLLYCRRHKRSTGRLLRPASYHSLSSWYADTSSLTESGTRGSNATSFTAMLPPVGLPLASTASSGHSGTHSNGSAESVGLLGDEVDRLSRIERLD